MGKKRRKLSPSEAKAVGYGYKPSGGKKKSSGGGKKLSTSGAKAASYGYKPSGASKPSTPTYKGGRTTNYGFKPAAPTSSPAPKAKAGPRISESSTVTRKSARKDYLKSVSRRNARDYTQERFAEALEKYAQKDDEGKPKTKTVKVPATKRSEEKIAADLERFEQKVAKIAKSAPSKRVAAKQIARARSRVLRRNFELTKRGEIKEHKTEVPVWRKGTKKERAAMLEDIAKNARMIRKSKPAKPDPSKEQLPRLSAVDPDKVHNPHSLGGIIKGIFGRSAAGSNVAGAGLIGADIDTKRLAENLRPTTTGVTYLMDALTRPGVAVETAVAKGLVAAGAIKGKTAEKIRKAPGPGEAFLRGHSDPEVVSGGDITQGLFGAREAGLAADVITDPLMYIGAGALARGGSSARRALTRIERLNKHAPNALRTGRFKRLTLEADRSGDFRELDSYLKRVEKNALTRTQRARGGRAGRKALKQKQKDINQELLNAARARMSKAPTIAGKKVTLPGSMVSDATALVARHGVGKRAIDPGFRIRLMTPLGREIAHIPVRLPGKTPVPTSFGRRARYLRESARESEIITRNLEDLAKSRKEIDQAIKEAQRNLDKTRVQQLRADRNAIDNMEAALQVDARRLAANQKRLPGFERLEDLTERVSSRRLIHETFRTSNHFARQFEQEMQRTLSRALKPIEKDADSMFAVTAYRLSKQDTGSGAWFTKNIRPLTATERQVVANLDKLDRTIGHHGLDAGTLNTMIDNYTTRLYQRTGDPMGTVDPTDLRQDFPQIGRTPSSQPFYARHREQPEMASIADPNVMAAAIKRLSKGRVSATRARELADQWHRLGRIRGTIERLARAAQRGQRQHWDDLTDLEQQAVRWEQHMARQNEQTPIFKDIEETDGQLVLTEDRTHGFTPDAFGGLDSEATDLARLHSAMLDRAALQEGLKNVTGKTRKQYEVAAARLDEEIEALTPSPTPPTWRKVRKGRYETEDSAFRITKGKRGWRLVATDEPRKAIATAKTLKAAKEQIPVPPSTLPAEARQRYLDLVQRGGRSFDNPPFQGSPSHYGDGRSDPFDFTGRLDDARGGVGDPSSAGLFPVLDPRVTTFYRTRVEGIQTAMRARWQGLDSAVGRSISAHQGKRYIDYRGNEGFVTELKPIRDKDGRLTAYENRTTGKTLKPEEVDIPDDVFIPNRDKSIFYDPKTGDEFMRPIDKDPIFGGYVQRAIGEDRMWPTRAIEDAKMEMLRQGEEPIRQIYETGMEHGFGRVMSMVRFGVTTPFPAYHVRNMISDALKSLQADSGVIFHPVMNAKLTWLAATRRGRGKIKVKGFPKDLSPGELAFITDLFGIRSTQHLAEYLRIASTGKVVSRRRRRFSPGPEGQGRHLIEAGARREDVMRFITFAQRMRTNGGDVADAAWFMTKHHFDYADLTAFERRAMRNIFLFYTWYRRNIPLQFLEIISRPGFFSGVANGYYALSQGETPLNVDWSQLHPLLPDMSGQVPIPGVVPDHMLGQLGAIVTNWNEHTFAVAFGAPWVDMNLVTNMLISPQDTARQWWSMLNPALAVTAQYIFGNEILTGRDFKKYEPTAGFIGDFLKQFGVTVKTDPETGGPLVPWALGLFLRNIPVLGRGSSYFLTSTTAMDTGTVADNRRALSFAFGLNTYMSPSRERLPAVWYRMVQARVGERRSLSEGISNLTDEEKKKQLAAFDRETLRWAKEKKIPVSFLETIEASGFYKPKEGPKKIPDPMYGLDSEFDFEPNRTGKKGEIPKATFGAEGSSDDFDFEGFKAAERGGKRHWKPRTPRERKMVGKDGKVEVNVPDGVPKKFKSSIAKWGPKLDKVAKRYGLDGPTLMAKTFQGESNWQAKATSSAGAHGWAQFMPGTRAAVIAASNGKVDPWRSFDEAAQAMVMHMTGQLGNAPGLEGYNPNGGQKYVDYILGQDVGKDGKVKVKVPKPLPGPWQGAQKAVLRVVPKGVRAEGRGDKRTPAENASVKGSPTSDHLTTNTASYAADIPGTLEDGKTDKVAAKIAKKLGMASHRGTNEVVKNGYRYQLIWQDDGHYDHVHLGASWVGEADSPPVSTSWNGAPTSPTVTDPNAPPATTNPGAGDKVQRPRGARDPIQQVRRFQRRFLPPREERLESDDLAENVRVADGDYLHGADLPELPAETVIEDLNRALERIYAKG